MGTLTVHNKQKVRDGPRFLPFPAEQTHLLFSEGFLMAPTDRQTIGALSPFFSLNVFYPLIAEEVKPQIAKRRATENKNNICPAFFLSLSLVFPKYLLLFVTLQLYRPDSYTDWPFSFLSLRPLQLRLTARQLKQFLGRSRYLAL